MEHGPHQLDYGRPATSRAWPVVRRAVLLAMLVAAAVLFVFVRHHRPPQLVRWNAIPISM